jgi:hypothetical protein
MKHILFFAVENDLLPVFERVENEMPLKYVLTGHMPTAAYQSFARGTDLPNLGIATASSETACDTFLVTKRAAPITLRPIRYTSGIEVFAVDQLLNPDTVTLTPGGVWDKDIVLNGRVATASESLIAQDLMKRFHAAVKKHFRKVKAFWVGPKAFELLNAGKRLAGAAQSPRLYDLTIT